MSRPFRTLTALAPFALALSFPLTSLLAQDAAGPASSPPANSSHKHQVSEKDRPVDANQTKNPVLWEDPGNIAQKDLFLGRGGAEHQPKGPFTFVSEDHNGTNPKFDVRDADGKKWRVKLGTEARPEVVASRLLWAVGYFANEDYLLPNATVANLNMRRGRDLIHGDAITDARFARKPGSEKKIGDWRWKSNPFKGSRELNGLRVMMAVMNNWDLKDVNNAVYQDDKHDRQIFLVSDVGATFASNDEHIHHDTDKGNLASYEHSKFITKKTGKDVSFGTPMLPVGLLREGPVLLGETVRRSAIDWIGKDIPIADARWVGGMLAQLSHKQLEDAFRAGNFPDDEREAFVSIVESRIAELKSL
jgi:hypothetical protein